MFSLADYINIYGTTLFFVVFCIFSNRLSSIAVPITLAGDYFKMLTQKHRHTEKENVQNSPWSKVSTKFPPPFPSPTILIQWSCMRNCCFVDNKACLYIIVQLYTLKIADHIRTQDWVKEMHQSFGQTCIISLVIRLLLAVNISRLSSRLLS